MKQVEVQAMGRVQESFRFGSGGKNWGEALTRWTPNGRAYLGTGTSGETLTFTTDELEVHRALLIRMKLFVIYHWDGNWTVYGPDLFRVQLNRRKELLRTSFSNYGLVHQSYPDNWPWGEHKARSGAKEMGTLAWQYPGGWGEPLDAVYDLSLGVAHLGKDITLEMRGDFHDVHDPSHLRGEQWGIESLEILAFEEDVKLPEGTWSALAKDLLSSDVSKVATARALLPLGGGDTILPALAAAAAPHGLDRESLEKAAAQAEAEKGAEMVAEAFEEVAENLRRKDADPANPAEPSKATRASRLYHVLRLSAKGPAWSELLWNEMNRGK